MTGHGFDSFARPGIVRQSKSTRGRPSLNLGVQPDISATTFCTDKASNPSSEVGTKRWNQTPALRRQALTNAPSPPHGDLALDHTAGIILLLGHLLHEDLLGKEAGVLPDSTLDFVREFGIVSQELLGVLAALTETLAVI